MPDVPALPSGNAARKKNMVACWKPSATAIELELVGQAWLQFGYVGSANHAFLLLILGRAQVFP